jgi:molybdate transport system substrate-binding protein
VSQHPPSTLESARRHLFVALAALFIGCGGALADAPRGITVYAAASLTDSVRQLGADFTRETGTPVKFSFAASSALARQIEAGAPADAFLSADTDWMDYLAARNLVQTATRRNILGNRLVLIAPAESKLALKIEPHFAIRAALGAERLATGDPGSVPVGRYAHDALVSLGVWEQVADRLVRAENVRSALMFVARGEVPLGIVYETDAKLDPRVRIIDAFPASSHAPIVYPAALTRDGAPDAKRFLDYLRGAHARQVFGSFGFTVLD